MKNLETEFKWEANSPRAFLKMLSAVKKQVSAEAIGAKNVLHIVDVYLDHADHRFEKEELAFRVRHFQDTWEATFKTRTQLVNGKALRREETQRLQGVKNLQQALEKLVAQKEWKKLSLVGLQPMFTIKNKRIVRQISQPKFQAEFAFDTCLIIAGTKRAHLKEIELELKRGDAASFEEFAACVSRLSGLLHAKTSKVKTAVKLLKSRE